MSAGTAVDELLGLYRPAALRTGSGRPILMLCTRAPIPRVDSKRKAAGLASIGRAWSEARCKGLEGQGYQACVVACEGRSKVYAVRGEAERGWEKEDVRQNTGRKERERGIEKAFGGGEAPRRDKSNASLVVYMRAREREWLRGEGRSITRASRRRR